MEAIYTSDFFPEIGGSNLVAPAIAGGVLLAGIVGLSYFAGRTNEREHAAEVAVNNLSQRIVSGVAAATVATMVVGIPSVVLVALGCTAFEALVIVVSTYALCYLASLMPKGVTVRRSPLVVQDYRPPRHYHWYDSPVSYHRPWFRPARPLFPLFPTCSTPVRTCSRPAPSHATCARPAAPVVCERRRDENRTRTAYAGTTRR